MKQAASPYWVVVADSGCARIFELDKTPPVFREVQELISDSRHKTSRELVSSASGRIANVKGGPSSHTMQPRSDAHDLAEQAFCSRLAKILQQAVNRNLFDSLVIVADPRTLGRLRQEMNKSVTARIKAEVNRDWVGLQPGDLERRVREELDWTD